MKTIKTNFILVIASATVLLSAVSCTEEDPVTPGTDPRDSTISELLAVAGITEEYLENYQGDAGLVISARKVAKKGYKPVSAVVEVQSSLIDLSQTLVLDPYLFLAQISIPVDSLDEDQRIELINGVDVNITLLDKDGAEIISTSHNKVSIKTDPAQLTIDKASLKDLETRVNLKENTPYYIQTQEGDVPMEGCMKKGQWTWLSGYHIEHTQQVEFTGEEEEPELAFYFQSIPGEENTYAILDKDKYYLKIVYDNTHLLFRLIRSNTAYQEDPGNLEALYHFKIEKAEEGGYAIRTLAGAELIDLPGEGFVMSPTFKNGVIRRFRFVPMNVLWDVENIGTRYLEPILPAAKTGFGFNNTLVNCGSGELEQTVGIEVSREVSTTVGWEETFSQSSSHTAGVSLTVGVEFEAKFFGNKAKYSAELTGSYEYTTTSGTTSTDWAEETQSSTETYFSHRLVAVPPKHASLVYDAYQYYETIKVNFVQRMRVRASDFDSGEKLTGEEIKSQFHFINFNGIITEVGSDYIEIALQGVASLDGFLRTNSEVIEVDPKCK